MCAYCIQNKRSIDKQIESERDAAVFAVHWNSIYIKRTKVHKLKANCRNLICFCYYCTQNEREKKTKDENTQAQVKSINSVAWYGITDFVQSNDRLLFVVYLLQLLLLLLRHHMNNEIDSLIVNNKMKRNEAIWSDLEYDFLVMSIWCSCIMCSFKELFLIH